MATAERQTLLQVDGSDTIYDFPCTPCTNEEKNSEGEYQCIKCDSYYCNACVKMHDRIHQSHTVFDKAAMKSTTMTKTALPHFACENHPGEDIKLYCPKHDKICCTVCISVEHRSCKGVDYIPKVAIGIGKTSQTQTAIKTLENVIGNLQKLKTKKQKALEQSKKDSKTAIGRIVDTKKRLIAKIEKMATKGIEEVKSRLTAAEKAINSDIARMDAILKTLHENLTNIPKCQNDEKQLFVRIKQVHQQSSQGNDCLDEIESTGVEPIEYIVSPGVQSLVSGQTPFGFCSVGNRFVLASSCGSGIEVGDRVKIKASVTTPSSPLGNVTHQSVGIVTKVKSNNVIYIDFPESKKWKGKREELELVMTKLRTHSEYKCDGCMMDPIIGAKYRCTKCFDFDLCETCFCTRKHHHILKKKL